MSTVTTGQLLVRLQGGTGRLFHGPQYYLFSKPLFFATASKLLFTHLGSLSPEKLHPLFYRWAAQPSRDEESSRLPQHHLTQAG